MSLTVSKGGSHRQTRTRRTAPEDRSYMSLIPAPTYAEIQSSEYLQFACEICTEVHPLKDLCRSKPEYPPSSYFPKCEICLGFHPRGRCYFEYMRTVLFTPSMCENCKITHTGFCKSTLLCQLCNNKHNFADGCTKLTSTDLSNNECPNCGVFHSLHCPAELPRIKTDLILWCNRCKVQHSFMNCVPFCNRCFRRHREGPCPESWTFCSKCNYCHQGESCQHSVIRFGIDKQDRIHQDVQDHPPFTDLQDWLVSTPPSLNLEQI